MSEFGDWKHKTEEDKEVFGRLMDLIRTLRSENGCPWDMKQTPQTIHPYILEEYHEMVEAINQGAARDIADEMGDLIFLALFLAYIFEQQGTASLSTVMEGAVAKMTRRHPHVFGDVEVRNAEDVIQAWSKIKAQETGIKERSSILDGVPRSLPALNRAQKLARRASKVGFDWTRPQEVIPKIDEEMEEFKRAVAAGSVKEAREELGDLLFVIVNAARLLDINSEAALNEASDKFERRFRHIESRLKEQGKTPMEADLQEMDTYWEEAKRLERE